MTNRAQQRGLAALVALAACDQALAPSTEIAGPRVLAITTEPSALAVDGALDLVALTVDPDGPRIGTGAAAPAGARPVDAVRMRACAPWRFIADPGRDCAGDLALPIEPDGAGRFAVSAEALAARFPAPPGTPAPPDPWQAALAAGLELRVPIIVEVEVDGTTLVARRDVAVVEAAMPRQNPRLVELRFDGAPARTLRAGQRYALTVVVDRDSLDERPEAGQPGVREDVVCNFYSPAGTLADAEVALDDPQAPVPATRASAYTPGAPGPTWLFVVATDETGGMSAISVPLTIE